MEVEPNVFVGFVTRGIETSPVLQYCRLSNAAMTVYVLLLWLCFSKIILLLVFSLEIRVSKSNLTRYVQGKDRLIVLLH